MQQKDFVVEDGYMYYPKKALYKQPLFWTTIIGAVASLVLGVTCLLLIIGLGFSELSLDHPSTEFDSTRTYREHEVGESVDFADGLRVTVQSMGQDDSVDLVDDYYPSAYVVDLEVENPGQEDIYFDEYYFNLIDLSTDFPLTLDLRIYDVNLAEKIKAGEKISVRLIYGLDGETNLGFVYDDVMWTEQLIGQGI